MISRLSQGTNDPVIQNLMNMTATMQYESKIISKTSTGFEPSIGYFYLWLLVCLCMYAITVYIGLHSLYPDTRNSE